MKMMPDAFMGYKIARDGLYIRCCSYCPDKAELEHWAEHCGTPTPVTHSICPKCFAAQMDKLVPDFKPGEAEEYHQWIKNFHAQIALDGPSQMSSVAG